MPLYADVFSLDSNEKTIRDGRGARRTMLLLGTSLFVYAAIPSAALAQNECGPPPGGPGSVSCPPSGNPYPGGITYINQVNDLTIVLEPDVVVHDTVQTTSTTSNVDLRIEGGTDTLISTTADASDGVDINSTLATAYASLDVVTTTGSSSIGIDANGGGGATVFVNSVSTTGNSSGGIEASANGGSVFVGSGSVTTDGTYSDGIFALNTGGSVEITSGTVVTSGNDSDGIEAASFGTIDNPGFIAINSGSVTTDGTDSTGIRATSSGSINIDSGSVLTNQSDSAGIEAFSSGGSVTVNSASVVTHGDDSIGIDAEGNKYDGDATVSSGTVSTEGDNSTGIYAVGASRVTVTSGSVTTIGDNSAGIDARQFVEEDSGGGDALPGSAQLIGEGPGVVVNSDFISTGGNFSPGINGDSADGFVQITSGVVNTAGNNSPGINATALTDIEITSGTVTTGGDYSDGIHAASFDGPVVITSGSVTTNGLDSDGIFAEADGDIDITSTGTVSTGDDDSTGIYADSKYGSVEVTSATVSTLGDDSIGIAAYSTTNVTVTSTSVTTAGDNSTGIVAVQSTPPPAPPAPGGAAAVIGVGPGVTIASGTVSTTGNNSGGIDASSADGYVQVTSTSVTTTGTNSTGILAVADTDIAVTSGAVTTTGDGSIGILALSKYGPVAVTSGTVSTAGDGAIGIGAISIEGNVTVTSTTVGTTGEGAIGIGAASIYGNVTVTSGTVSTTGDDALGIAAASKYGNVGITSSGVTTTGDGSTGIFALTGLKYGGGDITISSTGTVSTTGNGAGGIYAAAGVFPDPADSDGGSVAITSNIVTTTGADAPGITAIAYDNVTIGSTSVTTTGANSTGIYALAMNGNVAVTSGTVTTNGNNAIGILAAAPEGTVTVTSGTVTTHGTNSTGIDAVAGSNVVVGSTAVTTTGANSIGIYAYSAYDNVTVTSGTVTTSGAGSGGIVAIAYNGGNTTVTSGTVSTTGAASAGIYAYAFAGNVAVTSTAVTTAGANSTGIEGVAIIGSTTITSGNVTTTGAGSDGIYGFATDDVTVTSTGTVRTGGLDADGIVATALDRVVVNSNIIITTGNDSAGIYATELGASSGQTVIPGGSALLGPSGGITITSANITTSGSGSVGIDAFAVDGAIEITSTGAIATSGANSHGILTVTQAGITTLDVNNISVTGATADAIRVTSVGASTITIRGLVQATNGFEVQANGGAATVNTTATGTIRGAIDLTDNADRVNNAGIFDAIGTSLFGAGTDIFANTGTTRSTNGAAVLAALEQFNNSGLVEMRDGAVGDTLNVTGAFTGSGASRLGVDSNISNNTSDVLITGVSSGSTILDVTLIGAPVFNLTGTLVVDATAGTSATAFTLASTATSSLWVKLNLLFDAPNNNFLLVGLPDQPVFESVMTGEMMLDFWYTSADAITAQLEAARDGLVPNGGTNVGNLAGGGRFGGWVQVLAGKRERDATQSFTNGGNTTVFDTSYEQDFQGIQGGLDYQSGGAIIGLSFGAGRSEADFDATFNGLKIDGMNLAAYAAFTSGSFFINGLAKVDWANVESFPGAGLSARFDATAWGLRANLGFRFELGGHMFAEPSASLSWVNVDIDDYSVAGATVAFDDITSLRGVAGLRIGGEFPSGNGTFTPFVGLHAIEEFDGDVRNNFTLGTTIGILQDAPGTFGEASAGLNYSTGRLEAFIRGELDFGGETEGLSGRAGVRLRF
jgi:hypothetical protein